MSDERAFAVGRNLAVTPGSVVFRNELIELIQYAPTTARVHRRPLVIVPPCINKYYILDLQPENSFVRWAVGEGHTVFMISWRNVPPELGRLTWDDYLATGVLARDRGRDGDRAAAGPSTRSASASAARCSRARSRCSPRAATAASRARRCSRRCSTSPTRATSASTCRASCSPRASRRSWRASASHGSELAGAFASLRANDLVWNYVVGNYLKGETPPAFDLLYWNGDSANLPGPMYAYYLATCTSTTSCASAAR